MKLDSIRRNVLAVLAVALSTMPASPYADVDEADVSGAVVSDDGTATDGERTLEATQGRVKAQESVNVLSKDIQELKLSVIALNKNLRVLEEDLLFPANTQVNVFLSLDVGKFFTLESVKLKLDGKVVASHIYSGKELVALSKGGIHKLHMANLSVGEHTLSAFFTGMGPSGREYKRGTTLNINKESGPKYVELNISDSSMKLQPEYSVKQW
ncbi:MAG: AraC family transcriptional regulator [Pseudomonadota bacterium]